MNISKKQFQKLLDLERTDTEKYHVMLSEVCNIKAVPITEYQYYDEFGNYLGSSFNETAEDLIKNAYITLD